MAKKGGSQRKTKTGAGELIATVLLVADGGRRIITGDYTTIQWHLSHGSSLKQIIADEAVRAKLVDPAVGVAEIVVGPKAVKTAKKALPATIKRAKIPGSRRTWV